MMGVALGEAVGVAVGVAVGLAMGVAVGEALCVSVGVTTQQSTSLQLSGKTEVEISNKGWDTTILLPLSGRMLVEQLVAIQQSALSQLLSGRTELIVADNCLWVLCEGGGGAPFLLSR